MKEQFDNKIKHISLNMELIVKLIYFTPCKLLNSSIHLIRAMLDYPRYKKLGVFAVYCIALMIQDNQAECCVNLIPVFNDEAIMEEIFNAIKDVEKKFSKVKDPQKLLNKGIQKEKDMLEKFE